MTSRISQPDTSADIKIRELLDGARLPGFTVIAGAGSGKTTSLVKALAHIVLSQGEDLRRRGQQVACITYTEAAANEILFDLKDDPLAKVSTIHSFIWSILEPFQRDVAAWLHAQTEQKLVELLEKQAGFSSRVGEETRAKTEVDIEKLRAQLRATEQNLKFRHSVATDISRGAVGHEDVLKMGKQFILEKPLLSKLLARRFPYVLVDESQDTFPDVVSSLKHVKASMRSSFCLSFFGDPMQRVYPRGIGDIALEAGWFEVKKPENFRSPRKVLDVMNHIRSAADGLVQKSGLSSSQLIDGEVYYFVLPADHRRTESFAEIRAWLDSETRRGAWTDDDPALGAKVLVIAHRMAARRLGFADLYAAFHDSGSSSMSRAFDDGTAWPVKFFSDVVIPLAFASSGERIPILRAHSPRLRIDAVNGQEMRELLSTLDRTCNLFAAATREGGPGSIGRVLRLADQESLITLDPRLEAFLRPEEDGGVVLSDGTAATLDSFLKCDTKEVICYDKYIKEASPYCTHQGVKGTEHPRVIVVLDDEEGNHNQFSYDKLLNIRALSAKDIANAKSGKDTVIDRTRRLLYVCASRSTEALAVVLFAENVDEAVTALRSSRLPGASRILTLDQEKGVHAQCVA